MRSSGSRRVVRGLSLAVAAVVLGLPAISDAGPVRFEGEGHAENPAWSLDGKHLSFEVNRLVGNIDMYFAEVNGDIAKDATPVRLPGSGSGFGGSSVVVINAAWHPDGVAVFEGTNSGGDSRLYFAQPGGAAAAEMLSSSQAKGKLTFPTISSDGNFLGFVSDDTGAGDIRTFDRSSGAIAQVTSSPETESFPAFSPTGDKVLFTRKFDNDENVFLRDIGTGDETEVAKGDGDQTRPQFAGTATVVYFEQGASETWNLAVSAVDGSGKMVLAENVRLPTRGRPAVSPDGEWVAYGSADPTKDTKVYLTSLDGSKTIEVDTEYVACGEPAIGSQNGQTLLAFTALPGAEADWRLLNVVDITDQL